MYRQAPMPSLGTFALFSVAAVALAVVPGPAVTYIVTQSVDKGRRAGLVSALGVSNGGLVHVAAATVGLSALIASSATAFTAVKLIGAAYLIVVGIRRIRARDDEAAPVPAPAALQKLYVQGLVVNILNPKTALFFLAFLPQFVDRQGGSVALQVATLGCLFVAIALTSDAAYALAADALAGRLRRNGVAARARRLVSGGIFIALGVSAAAARRAT
jgi:threonine/homoserine/homoserine lactone efflux protein